MTDQKKNGKDDAFENFSSFPTGVETLDVLLAEPNNAGNGVADADANGGFAHIKKVGFFGVVFGASCSGKSVLCLELAARFVSRVREQGRRTSSKGIKKADDKRRGYNAVLLTHEPLEVVEARAFSGFGFLKPGQVTRQLGDISAVEGEGKLCIVQMPLEPDKQQNLLIDVFEYLNHAFCQNDKSEHGGDEDPKTRLLVVVDNAETIRTEAYMSLINSYVEQPKPVPAQRKEFCKLLREYCAEHRLRTWFCFEEDASQSTMDEASQVATAAETYAADATIRLGMSVLKDGFRERTLEIVKARDRYYRRGTHHFTIRGYKPGGMGGPSATEDPTATGIIVFPSVPTQQHRLSREAPEKKRTTRDDRSTLGIQEIDESVRTHNEYNADFGPDEEMGSGERSTRLSQDMPGYLCAATVSVLVSDLDSVGTDMAIHFVAQGSPEKKPSDVCHPWLYISLHHEPHMLRKIAGQYGATSGCVEALRRVAKESKVYGENQRVGRCLFFPPEHISASKLLHDIDAAIIDVTSEAKTASGGCKHVKPLRVVVDDLFALDKRFPLLTDHEGFVAALFELFRQRGVIALVLDTVEVGEGKNPVEQSVPAGMADHVFLLRHIEVQNVTRKVFSILKLAEFIAPTDYWDIFRDGSKRKLVADARRLQFFKGLLSGRPEPVKITLSMYADSHKSPQHRNIKRQRDILRNTFGLDIDLQACHPEDYAVLQQTVGQTKDHSLQVIGDCHIVSIDEIWLEDLIENQLIVGFAHRDGSDGWHWDEGGYVSTAHDLALIHHPPKDGIRRHYAIPDRHNLGVLCYYKTLKERLSAAIKEGDEVLKLPINEQPPSWDELVAMQMAFVTDEKNQERWKSPVKYRHEEPGERKSPLVPSLPVSDVDEKPMGVFTFSMENRECCVSFLLELVASLLVKGQSLVTEKRTLNFGLKCNNNEEQPTVWERGLQMLFELLDPWDIHRLADCIYRPSHAERPCLYSRQWFTGWGALGLKFPGLEVLPLPKGQQDVPTPVSGTWYLGMLKGTTAIAAGKMVIQRLTDPENELDRFNYGIALPVKSTLYEGDSPFELLHKVPTPDQEASMRRLDGEAKSAFLALGMASIRGLEHARERWRSIRKEACEKAMEDPEHGDALDRVSSTVGRVEVEFDGLLDDVKNSIPKLIDEILEPVRASVCPVFRTTIKDYSTRVSPVLMGLIVRTARELIRDEGSWLKNRITFPHGVIKEKVTAVAKRFIAN